MSETEKGVIETTDAPVKKDHNKYRKPKPWDNDPTIDKF